MQDDRGSNVAGSEGSESRPPADRREREELRRSARTLAAREPTPSGDAAEEIQRVRDATGADGEGG